MGYPQIKKPTPREVKMKKIFASNKIRRDLKSQMDHRRKWARMEKIEDLVRDEEYLSGWKERKDVQGHIATGGNLGMVDGPSKEQIEKKDNEIVYMKELWQKSKDIQTLKKKMQNKLCVTIDKDSVDHLMA